jgi:YHS domain-containing protein
MPTMPGLTARLDAEFTTAKERIRRQGEESARDNPEGKLDVAPSPPGGSATLRLMPNLATITLSFSLSHDGPITKAYLDCDLEVIPVYVQFDPHGRQEIAPEAPDYEQIGRWMDDRIVSFARTYLAVQFNEHYQSNNIVTDPVARTSFPKVLAESSWEYQGKLYYFVSAQTRQAFEKAPARYLDSSAAGPRPAAAV